MKARAFRLGAVIEARRDADENPEMGLSVVGTDKADPDEIAEEIVEDLRSAVEQIEEILGDLQQPSA